MALGLLLTRLISFIPNTMLTTVCISIVLIITLCNSDKGPTTSASLLKPIVTP